jgi:hypothetical protein
VLVGFVTGFTTGVVVLVPVVVVPVVLVVGVVGLTVETAGFVVVVVGLVVLVKGLVEVDVGLVVEVIGLVPVVALPAITELGFAVVFKVEVAGFVAAGFVVLVKVVGALFVAAGFTLGAELTTEVVGLELVGALLVVDVMVRGVGAPSETILGDAKSSPRVTLVKFPRLDRSANSRALGNLLTALRFCRIAMV